MSIIAGVLGGVASGFFGSKGASDAADAQAKIATKQKKLAEKLLKEQKKVNREMYQGQTGDIRDQYGRGMREVADNYARQTGLADRQRGANAGYITGLRDKTAGLNRSNLDYGTRQITDARDQSLAGFQPVATLGNNALAAYGANLGLNNGQMPKGYTGLSMSPSEQFLLSQGVTDVQGSAAGRGSLDSGATLEALERLRTGLVSQSRDRQQAELFGLGGMGQNALAMMADVRGSAADRLAGMRDTYTGRETANNAGFAAGMMGNEADYYGTLGAARENLTAQRLGLGQTQVQDMGTNRWNNAGIQGQATQNFGTNALTALANRGDAQAAGAIGGANAWQNAINTGFGIAGYGAQPGTNPFNLGGLGTGINNWLGNLTRSTNYASGMPNGGVVNGPMARPA